MTEHVSTQTRRLVLAALFAALTCVATSIIKIPTPTQGYIHLGDGLVLLSAFLLDPVAGVMAAAIGSAMADLLGGYLVYVPATFLAKGLTALAAGLLARHFQGRRWAPLLAGVVGEAVMVLCYFVFEAGLGLFGGTALGGAVTAAAIGIPFNLVQGASGVVFSLLLLPILSRVPAFR